MQWITPVDISPATSLSWQEVDVSSYFTGTISGVILQIHNIHFGTAAIGWRMKGSTDDITTSNHPGMFTAFCGVDASNKLELYCHSSQKVYLIAAFDDTDAHFFTNHQNVSTNTTGSWVDTDISSYVQPGDTASGAILEFIGNAQFAFRKNGATYERYSSATVAHHQGFMVQVDTNGVFEQKVGSTSNNVFLVGYIKSGSSITFEDPPTDVSPSSTGWSDLPALESGAAGALYGFFDTGSVYNNKWGIRQNGATSPAPYDKIADTLSHTSGAAQADVNGVIEAYISNTNVDVFLIAYNIESSGTSVTVNAGVQSLATSLPTPSISTSTGVTVLVGVQTISETAPIPTLTISSASSDVTISASAQAISVSQPAPTVTAEVHTVVSAGVQSVTLSQPTPTVTAVQNVTVSADTQTANATLPSPTVTAGDSVTIQANVQSVSVILPAPTVSVTKNVTVSPSVQTVTVSEPSPTVSTTSNVTITPSALAVSVSLPDPTVTITGGQTVEVGVQSVTVTLPEPTISAVQNVTLSPSVQTLAVSLPSVTVVAIDTRWHDVTGPQTSYAVSEAVSTHWTTASSPQTSWAD